MKDIHHVINHAKFGDDRLRGSGVVAGQISAFPIDFAGRPYNTLTLLCERVIYIPPGDTRIAALELLDDVISRILQNHSNLVICMDANARNAIWHNSCIGIAQSHQSIKMGSKLEHITRSHGSVRVL